jgi:hypothetical protein
MSRITTIALVLAVLLAVPVSAQAKGPEQVTAEGPYLGRTVTITPGGAHPPAVMSLLESTRLFESILPDRDEVRSSPPTEPLGRRLVLTWSIMGPSGTFDVVQHVYPDAEEGPLVFVPPHQIVFDRDVAPGGWFDAHPRLPELVAELFTPPAAAPTATPASSAQREPETVPGPTPTAEPAGSNRLPVASPAAAAPAAVTEPLPSAAPASAQLPLLAGALLATVVTVGFLALRRSSRRARPTVAVGPDAGP